MQAGFFLWNRRLLRTLLSFWTVKKHDAGQVFSENSVKWIDDATISAASVSFVGSHQLCVSVQYRDNERYLFTK